VKSHKNLQEIAKGIAKDNANILWVYCKDRDDWVRTDEIYDRDLNYEDPVFQAWKKEMVKRMKTDYNVRANLKYLAGDKEALNKTVDDNEEYLKNFREGSNEVPTSSKEKEACAEPPAGGSGKELMREMTGNLKYLAGESDA
jgi:hypothetical protein